ncbi:MAG: hypothetical protein K2J10_08965, partial [Muribaculaceae bacterium]|nr:hypothetical protein [Muribaculaceae bacterium]
NLSGKITNRSLMREERLEVPVRALREALINALCHRQWEKQNLTISIAVYDDRVEIANPGVFPPQIPIEHVKESHESYPYNRNMAQALYRSTFLESWGSGIHRIIEACREQGVEDPTWRWDGGFVYVTFKRPTKLDSQTAQLSTKQEDEPLNHRPSTDPVPVSSLESSSENDIVHQKTYNSAPESSLETILSSPEFLTGSSEQKVLMLLNFNDRMTLGKMAEYLNMTKRGVQKVTNRLQESGVLSREGSTKGGKWSVSNK